MEKIQGSQILGLGRGGKVMNIFRERGGGQNSIKQQMFKLAKSLSGTSKKNSWQCKKKTDFIEKISHIIEFTKMILNYFNIICDINRSKNNVFILPNAGEELKDLFWSFQNLLKNKSRQLLTAGKHIHQLTMQLSSEATVKGYFHE